MNNKKSILVIGEEKAGKTLLINLLKEKTENFIFREFPPLNLLGDGKILYWSNIKDTFQTTKFHMIIHVINKNVTSETIEISKTFGLHKLKIPTFVVIFGLETQQADFYHLWSKKMFDLLYSSRIHFDYFIGLKKDSATNNAKHLLNTLNYADKNGIWLDYDGLLTNIENRYAKY